MRLGLLPPYKPLAHHTRSYLYEDLIIPLYSHQPDMRWGFFCPSWPVFADTSSTFFFFFFLHPVDLSLQWKSPSQLPWQSSSPKLCRVAKLLTPEGLFRKVKLMNSLHYAAVSISNEILLLQGISLKHVIKQIKMSNSNESR